MLHELLEIFRRAPDTTLSHAMIADELGVSPGMLDHMLRTLVRSGRLIEVEHCSDCDACPLTKICVGGLDLGQRGYMLRVAR
ncbi:hypothetical protein EKD04_011725 [Chloroflexales bacterium ZM16-3]|nr:hypothetical protein [Chloroflexales bacterium ZM16-3]